MTFPKLLEKGVVPVTEKYEGSLSAATKEDMEQVAGSVLERLADLKDGIVMSEPRPLRNPHDADEAAVSHNALNLSFVHGWDKAPPYTEMTRVQCWHYPAD